MSTEETPVPGLDDEREQLPPMPPGWMPVSEAGAAAIHRHFNDVWLPVFLELAELDTAGAMGGIRAIIAERLRQVRAGGPVMPEPPWAAEMGADGYAKTGATAAAWIDVLLWRRRAVQDRELAEACEAAGLPDQAAKMRRSAARCQELADEVAAWPRWAWFA